MKVVELISNLCIRGGAEVFFDSLCNELSKNKDIDLYVIVLWDDCHSSFGALKQNDKIHFYTCGKNKNKMSIFKSSKRLKSILSKINPDIIHSHLAVFIDYFLAFGFREKKWKWIHTVHNIASKESNKIQSYLEKKYIDHHMLIPVGISSEITKSIKDFYSIFNVETIYNGVALKKNEEEYKKTKVYDLINVARMREQKNHIFLLNSFKKCVDKFPSMTLICVGDGPLFDSVKEHAKKIGIEENVFFAGQVDDVSSYFQKSRIFVLPSLYEGNPISVLEALNFGLPIVASNVGGLPDVIDLDNGFLFDVNQMEDFVNDILLLYTNKEIYDKLSFNNKIKAKSFSIEHCCEQYYCLFLKLVNNGYSHNN